MVTEAQKRLRIARRDLDRLSKSGCGCDRSYYPCWYCSARKEYEAALDAVVTESGVDREAARGMERC